MSITADPTIGRQTLRGRTAGRRAGGHCNDDGDALARLDLRHRDSARHLRRPTLGFHSRGHVSIAHGTSRRIQPYEAARRRLGVPWAALSRRGWWSALRAQGASPFGRTPADVFHWRVYRAPAPGGWRSALAGAGHALWRIPNFQRDCSHARRPARFLCRLRADTRAQLRGFDRALALDSSGGGV